MTRLSNVCGAIQQVKPHKIGIKFPKRQPWTPLIPKAGPKIPEDILSLSVAEASAAPISLPVKERTPVVPSNVPLSRSGKPKYVDIPVTGIRNVIAGRLSQSKQTIPHQYTSVRVNVENAVKLRKMLKERGTNVSMNDLVIKATAVALKKVPQLNAIWDGSESKQLEGVDMCMAVATHQGLFAPCLKGVDKLGLAGLNTAIKDIAGRAREGKLKPDEISGGGFTVSNLGMFGITEFTAVINPPQAGILAVGGMEESYSENGKLTQMTLTLSADGRSVGIDEAFKFVENVKEILENPRIMLML